MGSTTGRPCSAAETATDGMSARPSAGERCHPDAAVMRARAAYVCTGATPAGSVRFVKPRARTAETHFAYRPRRSDMMNKFFAAEQDQVADPADMPRGRLEVVHTFDEGPMPTGVSVSHTGRIFVNFP